MTIRSLSLAAFGGLALLASSAAPAAACQCAGQIAQAVMEITNTVSAQHLQTRLEIGATITQSTQQISAYLDRQVKAMEMLMDAEQLVATQRLKDEGRAIAESGRYDIAPGVCNDVVAADAASGMQAMKEQHAGVVQTRIAEWSSAAPGTPPAVGGVFASSVIVQDHEELKAAVASNGQPLAGMDADASILTGENWMNMPPNSQEMIAAQRFVRNVIDPTPPIQAYASMPPGPERDAAEAQAVIHRARISASDEVLTEILAQNTATSNVGQVLAASMQNVPTAGAEIPADGMVSWSQAMELQVKRRTANPLWFQQMQMSSPEAVMREQTNIMAMILDLLWETYKFDRRTAQMAAIDFASSMPDSRVRVTETSAQAASN